MLVAARGKEVPSICKSDKTYCLKISNHQEAAVKSAEGAEQPTAELVRLWKTSKRGADWKGNCCYRTCDVTEVTNCKEVGDNPL